MADGVLTAGTSGGKNKYLECAPKPLLSQSLVRIMDELNSASEDAVDDAVESLQVDLLRRHLYRPPDNGSDDCEDPHDALRDIIGRVFSNHLEIMAGYAARNIFDASRQIRSLQESSRDEDPAEDAVIPARVPSQEEVHELDTELVSLRKRLRRVVSERVKLRAAVGTARRPGTGAAASAAAVRGLIGRLPEGGDVERRVNHLAEGAEIMVGMIEDAKELIVKLDQKGGKKAGSPKGRGAGGPLSRMGATSKRIRTSEAGGEGGVRVLSRILVKKGGK